MRKLRIFASGALALLTVGLLLFVMIPRWVGPRGRVEAATHPIAAAGAEDRGDSCADVGERRACWSAACDGGVCAVARPIPGGPQPEQGWRCDGTGAARVCEARRRNGGSWDCTGAACVQDIPRMPDDGEWECVEIDGVAYCRGGRPASAVLASKPDLGWICGERRSEVPTGGEVERVCVDLAPDRPNAAFTKCRFDYSAGHRGRVCVAESVPLVGGACSPERKCPRGASCVAGACLPPPPMPSCWLDADCGAGGRCRWATCMREGA